MRNSAIPKNTQEIPVTEHVFEGRLYIKENDKWIWRLFRFDGSTFICLSTKKNKLPAPPAASAPAKNRTVRLMMMTNTNNNNNSTTSNYLSKWTIDVHQMSAISILKPKDKSITNKLKAFTIRTHEGHCYILKAHKQDDLERWIFVLSKMWKLSQHEPVIKQDTTYDVNFFQDVNTVCSDESIKRYNYQSLTYRTLSKRHQVKVVVQPQPTIYTDENVCLADVQKYLKKLNK
ncbi:hypothetical protein EDC94DRAFT_654598 [Helicostylum pulchrum]|uniref:PH domain-containing protein n=1 Tax=Helicostylum pulchrum TaxID=562976 RepID=A0ABP9XL18_9FUNG|nr:hypothetical protein EDC94DRAFT_654598 [Helicostylum pulchrum]